MRTYTRSRRPSADHLSSEATQALLWLTLLRALRVQCTHTIKQFTTLETMSEFKYICELVDQS
jgi:hypothetical protein